MLMTKVDLMETFFADVSKNHVFSGRKQGFSWRKRGMGRGYLMFRLSFRPRTRP